MALSQSELVCEDFPIERTEWALVRERVVLLFLSSEMDD
jgi:hypothetical protein